MAMSVTTEKDLAELKRYLSAIGDDPFKVYAGYVAVFLDRLIENHFANFINIAGNRK